MDVLSIVALVVGGLALLSVLPLYVPKRTGVYLDGQRLREGKDEDYVWVDEGKAGWQKRGRPKFNFRLKVERVPDVILVVWRAGASQHEECIAVEDREIAETYGEPWPEEPGDED
jgi:hypothetical protein